MGDCKKAPKSYFEKLLIKQGAFIDPEPVDYSIESLNKLHNEGFQIIFCTYPQYDSDYCIKEKIQWLQKYFKWFDIDKNLVFTCNKGLLANKNSILLDDNLNHILSFVQNGGTGCIFNKGWNNNNIESKYFHIYRIAEFKQFYNLIHRLENDFISDLNLMDKVNLHNKFTLK